MYLSGAVLAGISVKALEQINMVLFAVMFGLLAIVFTTYRRYTNDVKQTAAKAEAAERERAEQAEEHLKQLQHYVGELEKSSEASAAAGPDAQALYMLSTRDTKTMLERAIAEKRDVSLAYLLPNASKVETMRVTPRELVKNGSRYFLSSVDTDARNVSLEIRRIQGIRME
jgi:Tfp pilus assembly protein PilE